MNTTSHLPASFLVLPETGDRSVAGLYAKIRKIALRQLLAHPSSGFSPSFRRTLEATRRVLARIAKDHPAVLLEAIGHPDVQTPLLVADVPQAVTGHEPEALLKQALPPLMAILAHLAPKGVVPETILFDLPLDVLPDAIGHRLLRFDPPARGLLVDPLGLELNLASEEKVRLPPAPALPAPTPGLTAERPFHRLHDQLPRLEFALYDSNPLSMYEAHPDKWGNAISLGDKPLEHWLGAFHEALEIIRVALPEWFEELKASTRRFVPVGYLPERHLSASYREAPGIAYLTLCDEPITIAEAIVHETQHTKINLLSWLDPVVRNGMTAWTKSPVRPDLRPLWGVLLAVHAFVPVAAMYERLDRMKHPVAQRERFPRRWAEILRGNDNGMQAVLEVADPTDVGKRLIDEMVALHRRLMAQAPPPPPEFGAANKETLPDS
jgi:HEXXH motif-containing protein